MVDKSETLDVSILLTFHGERILAHSTLNSVERCRQFASLSGIKTEYVIVLDSADEETRRIVLNHPALRSGAQIVEVNFRDLGLSRNAGINLAQGTAIAILDGDDYYSENWLERAWHFLKEFGEMAIIHPEFVINFGVHAAYCWQVDQAGRYYDKNGLLINNYWTSWSFANRSTYLAHPYSESRPLETGFGYEDWHWNCETIAAGFEHRLAWGTVGFYRRKRNLSLVSSTNASGAVIRTTRLFQRCKTEKI